MHGETHAGIATLTVLFLLAIGCSDECPDSRPAIDSDCDALRLRCEYPAPGCGEASGNVETMTCTKNGWQTDGTHCDPALPPCPTSPPEPGSSCDSYPPVGPCSYPAPGCDETLYIRTTFHCEQTVWVPDGTRCNDAVEPLIDTDVNPRDASNDANDANGFACPPARPEQNTACSAIGMQCRYPAPGCDPDLGLMETVTCAQGVWFSDNLRCPECTETPPRTGSLCLPIGFECRYPAPNCGRDDIYETYTCHQNGWVTDGIHCEPQSPG